jgi:thiosulfate/3-mercaptopyruvate sulfurtransferase
MIPLVSTEWLAAHLSEVRVMDASWYMPDDKRDPHAEFLTAHIPGSVFFDIDANSDHSTDLPHMLAPPRTLSAALAALGIGDEDKVVVYDGAGLFSAARVWWMLRILGHENVAVLDGGLPKWRTENRRLESGPSAPKAAHFHARLNPALLSNFAQVKAILGKGLILDARSPGRFTGAEKEPRPGIKSGHMPGAINIHFRSLLNSDGTMKNSADLRRLFAEKGVDLRAPIITTCGSGVTAAIVMLALARLEAPHTSLYDGSWAEWGRRSDAPVVTG